MGDFVVAPASCDPNAKSFGADVAPEPLFPSFGNGNNQIYQQDRTCGLYLTQRGERSTSFGLGSVVGLAFSRPVLVWFSMTDDVLSLVCGWRRYMISPGQRWSSSA